MWRDVENTMHTNDVTTLSIQNTKRAKRYSVDNKAELLSILQHYKVTTS